MTDFPAPGTLPLFVSSLSRWGVASEFLATGGGAPLSITWTANLAVYVPVVLPWAYPVNRVWWINGATVGGNADFGIYTPSGSQIYHTGSTVTVTGLNVQYVTPTTPFVLPAGPYYFAWTCSGTIGVGIGPKTTTTPPGAVAGCLSQSTALPLPATATFATYSGPGIEWCGITQTVSGF